MSRFEKRETGCLDVDTGLEWSLESIGPMTWQEAMDYAAKLGDGWRLPTIKELINIVDYNKFNPATKLPDMKSSYYWLSTTYASAKAYIWVMNLDDGYVSYGSRTYNYYVRCVRLGKADNTEKQTMAAKQCAEMILQMPLDTQKEIIEILFNRNQMQVEQQIFMETPFEQQIFMETPLFPIKIHFGKGSKPEPPIVD